MSETIFRTGMCGLCGGKCAIGANIRDDHIISVQKLDDHPYLPSDICVRGAALKQFVHHPDRIQHPMKRVGSGEEARFVEVSWDEAISAIAERLLLTREEDGARSTIFYAGHPKWFRKTLAELSAAYGTPNFVSESSTCRSATAIGQQLVCGSTMFQPDAQNCNVYLIWSNNPAGQEGGVQDIVRLRKNGKKIIVVDPHVTGTTEQADLHLQPYPGTDCALALGIANVIISEGLEDKEYIKKYTYGFNQYREYVRDFTPGRVSEITGVPEEKITEAARLLGLKKVSLKMANCSLVHCINGVQNVRAVCSLLALTGSYGTEGGNRPGSRPMAKLDTFHHALVDRPDIEHDISDNEFPVWNEIINNEGQCIRLADVILNEKPYKIRNFIAFGMNVGMWPDCGQIVEALKKVEFSVICELFWNEACESADYVLPVCAAPERDQVVVGKKNHLVFVPKMIPAGDKLPDVEIMLRLAHAMDLHGNFIDQPDYDAYLNYTMRLTGVTLDELKASPDGIDARVIPPVKPFDPDNGFGTPTGKVEFLSTVMEKYSDLPGHDPLPTFTDWRDRFDNRDEYPFILVAGPRKPYFFHSRTYRMKWLSDLEVHTSVSICSSDADKLGVKDGERVRLSTPCGSMEYPVFIDNGLKSGVVYTYHDDGEQNINQLFDKDYIDPISGFPGFRSYICNLEKEGERS